MGTETIQQLSKKKWSKIMRSAVLVTSSTHVLHAQDMYIVLQLQWTSHVSFAECQVLCREAAKCVVFSCSS